MAVPITPDTTIYLLKCPLEGDNNHQLTFSNKTAQFNYFNSLPKFECDNVTYQRRDGVMRINENIDDIIHYNYVMYRNTNYSNKWYYAFITGMEYVNDEVTYVSIKTDTWQTWQFDLTFKRCFVEREHVNDDTIGLHTIPEGLEYGEYICNDKTDHKWASTNDGSVMICFQVTSVNCSHDSVTCNYPSSQYYMFNGIPQGCAVFALECTKENLVNIYSITSSYDNAGKGDAIVAITLVPRACCTWELKHPEGIYSLMDLYVPVASTSANTLLSAQITINNTINSYTPRNHKLFVYPYNYLYVTNNSGADVSYNYEDFNGSPTFALYGAFEQGGALMLMPQNSKKSAGTVTGDGWNEGIPAGKLPNLSWSSDYYLNWQAINGKNVEIQAGLSALSFGLGGGTAMSAGASGNYQQAGGAMPSLTGWMSQIANTMQQVREARMTPPQAKGNVSTGDIGFSSGETKFTFRKMSIKAEYARVIDQFFDLYGYKVNTVKVPNLTGRQNWNYVKLADANILGDIPQDDIAEIKGMFHNGVTLWHNPNTFLDYSQSNNIIS